MRTIIWRGASKEKRFFLAEFAGQKRDKIRRKKEGIILRFIGILQVLSRVMRKFVSVTYEVG